MTPADVDDDGALSLLAALIRENTVDPPGNEYRAAALVAKALAREEIESLVYEIAPGRTNLVARIPGTGQRPALAFSAHFDTIGVEREKWQHDPFAATIEDGKLYGRGATDMKSGMAAMVAATLALKRDARPLKGDLLLTFSAAENSSCLGAKRLVTDGHFAGMGALLVSEPSSLKVFVAEKGALWLRATARGEYGHNAFTEGQTGDRGNAIVRLAAFVSRAHELALSAPPHRHLKPPTINIGLIRGGLSTPLVPPECSADIDVRVVPGLSPEAVLAAFRSVAGAHIAVELLDYKPPVDTPDDHPFVRNCLDACRQELGRVEGPSGVPYYSDAAVIAPELGLPMVIIGPGEVGMSGAVDEHVDLIKFGQAIRIFRRIAESYLG